MNDIKTAMEKLAENPKIHDALEIAKSALKGAAIGGALGLIVGQPGAGARIGAVDGATCKIAKMKRVAKEFEILKENYA